MNLGYKANVTKKEIKITKPINNRNIEISNLKERGKYLFILCFIFLSNPNLLNSSLLCSIDCTIIAVKMQIANT